MTSSASLTIVIDAINQTNTTLKQIKADLNGIEAPAQKASSSLGGIQNTIKAGFAIQGVQETIGFLKSAGSAAAEDAASVARLKQAVENTGVSYASYNKSIEATISNGQKLGFTDDQTRSALAILTAQTNSAEEAQRRYALAQDLARGANIDVVTASRLLGKVTDENVTALNRYGISIAKGSTETELFAAVNAKFHGQAQAYADTTAGKYAHLVDEVNELKEAFGRLVVIPVANSILDPQGAAKSGGNFFTKLADDVNKSVDSIGESLRRYRNLLGLPANNNSVILQTKHDAEETIPVLSALEQRLAGLGGAMTNLANKGSLLIASQEDSLRAGAETARATEEAYAALAKSDDESDRAIAKTHYLALEKAGLAEQAQRDADAEAAYAKTLPGMVQALYDQAAATNLNKQAKLEYAAANGIATDSEGNALATKAELVTKLYESAAAEQLQKQALAEYNIERGIATDLEGKAIPTLQELVNIQLDSIAASERQGQAALIAAQQSYPLLVQQAKLQIQQSQLMEKAQQQANDELGITATTAKSTASSLNTLTTATQQATQAAEAYKAVTPSFSNNGNTFNAPGGSVSFYSTGARGTPSKASAPRSSSSNYGGGGSYSSGASGKSSSGPVNNGTVINGNVYITTSASNFDGAFNRI